MVVSIIYFSVLALCLICVRTSYKEDPVKKSYLTLFLLAFVIIGCILNSFANILTWRIALSYLLAAIAVSVVTVNTVLSLKQYLKDEEEYDDDDDDGDDDVDDGEIIFGEVFSTHKQNVAESEVPIDLPSDDEIILEPVPENSNNC